MRMKIIGCKEQMPLTFVGMCAGVSTNKMNKGDFVKRARRCFEEGHLSVFEHLKLTWVIVDVSRALTHQLVRHRHCAFTQESQRYTQTDTDKEWYILPETIDTPEKIQTYTKAMRDMADAYDKLIEDGVPKEDARMLLPNAAKTKIVVTMNMAEFFHFYKVRAEEHSQWEIRQLADDMLASISMLGGEWVQLAEMINEQAFKNAN